jgi:hypothetical protein
MDHLPSFGGSPEKSVFPTFAGKCTTAGTFLDYLERKSWDKQRLYKGQLEGRSFEETASILQSWMYFGLLYQVLQPVNETLNPSDFLRPGSDGKQEITTKKLPDYILR